MKNVLRLAALSAPALALACSASAMPILFADDFESGDLSSPQGDMASWVVADNAALATVSSVNPIDGNFSLRTNDNTTGSRVRAVGFFTPDTTTDPLEVSFDSRMDSFVAGNSNNLALRSGTAERFLILWDDGALRYRVGGGSLTTFGAYLTQTQNFQILTDRDAGTYDVVVDGVTLVADVAGVTDFDNVQISTGLFNGSQQDWTLDNIRVAVPEPGVATLMLAGLLATFRRRRG